MSQDIPQTRSETRTRKRARIGFLSTHPFQYSAPLYAYLNRTDDIEPVALYLTDFSLRGAHDRQFGRAIKWDGDLLAGYEHHFVGDDFATAEPYGFLALRAGNIERHLAAFDLDALVIHGHNHLALLQAMLAAHRLRIPMLYKGETHLLLPRSRLKGAVRRPVMSRLFRYFSGFLAVSQRNREFYRAHGVPAGKIFDYPYTVDNRRFVELSSLSAVDRSEVRAELGLSDATPVVIYASKFMPRKHPDDLIRACAQLRDHGAECQLLFVGTGEMEHALRALAAQYPALPVTFAGFRNQAELPRILGASDIFVLPSENEPFGLIINEAMCAGLPIVAAEEIGSVPDLVHQDVNGRLFDAGDVSGLANALEPILRDPALRRSMGEASRALMAGWDFERNLRGLRNMLARLPAP
ncbi:MAG: glycosyltransferase family 4 protein [Tsuneonella sp.]